MDQETINRVARVARLDLSEEEKAMYAKDLEDILEAFSVLDEAPSIEEFDLGPVRIEDIMRDDVVVRDSDPSDLRERMATRDDWVRGPRLS